jgi:nucleoside 2-deoxyribosyltransferase
MAREVLYLANQFGFSETGRLLLDKIIIPPLESKYKVLEPFRECARFYPAEAKSTDSYKKKIELLKEFNYKAGNYNNHLMRQSDKMAPILDGGHSVDDGIGSEIGLFYSLKKGPIIALRTDFRMNENIACIVNLQVERYIYDSGGKILTSLDEWFNELGIKRWHEFAKI